MFELFDSLVAEWPADVATEGPSELTELLRVLVGSAGHAMATAALVAVGGMDADALRQVVLGAEQLRRALDATQLHALAELASTEVTDRAEGTSTSRWLAREAQIPSGVARQRVAVASALHDRLPEGVDRAFTEGLIGFDHARVIAEATNERNHDQLADEIDHHLDSAHRAHVFRSWRRAFQARAALADEDGSFDPNAELARNRLRLSPSTDFMGLRGELVGDHALVVRDTIEALADELFLSYTRDHTTNPDIDVPNRATLRDVAVLLCDASVAATVLNGLGLPADAGRSARVPGPRLRRALDVRDGGCSHPGCDRPPRHCDAHHIVAWERGGRTDLANLVLLCRRHHRVAHRRGWKLMLGRDGWTRWTTPTGRTFVGQRHQQRHPTRRGGHGPSG